MVHSINNQGIATPPPGDTHARTRARTHTHTHTHTHIYIFKNCIIKAVIN